MAGLKMALCTPMPARTASAQNPPVGWVNRAKVAPTMRSTSITFIVRMTVRLLRRSANRPAMREVRMSGKVKTTIASVVWACEAVSSSGPGASWEATARMPSSATMNFHALSLKAPQNCAIKSPRSGNRVFGGDAKCGSMGDSRVRGDDASVCRKRRNDAMFPHLLRGVGGAGDSTGRPSNAMMRRAFVVGQGPGRRR